MRTAVFVFVIVSCAIAAEGASGQVSKPAAVSSAAQAPPVGAAEPAPSTASEQGKPGSAKPPAPENFTYQPEGRRDPFVSLLGMGSGEPRGLGKRGEGPAGMSVADISVRGVLESRGAPIAMIQGPDKKTYVVHQGDKFLDGTIRSITPQGLVVVQEVNDPLSVVKQREIRKLLRSSEGTKE